MLHIRLRKMPEHAQHLCQRDAARGRQRGRGNRRAAVNNAHRLAFDHTIGRQILRTPDAAGRVDRGNQILRHRALIKTAGTIARNVFQRIGETGLPQHEPRRRGAPIIKKHRSARRRTQHRLAQFGNARVTLISLEALARQPDGRCECLPQRQRAVTLRQMGNARGQTGNCRRSAAARGRILDRPALCIKKVPGLDAGRRGFARIDHHLMPVGRAMQQEETPATQS